MVLLAEIFEYFKAETVARNGISDKKFKKISWYTIVILQKKRIFFTNILPKLHCYHGNVLCKINKISGYTIGNLPGNRQKMTK